MSRSNGSRFDTLHRDPLAYYLVAEIGVNHEGSLPRALRMVNQIAAAGGHAAKVQVYKADQLAVRESPTYFQQTGDVAATQHAFFQRYDRLGPDDYRVLAAQCRSVGIDFLATPFAVVDVAWLDPLVPAFKIASADLTNHQLLRAVAHTGKPVILSTGAAWAEEIHRAVQFLGNQGAGPVAILHCVLTYPTAPDQANLGTIRVLHEQFPGHLVGWSDHVIPDADMTVPWSAYLMGARIIEKHFTDDKQAHGNDHYHSMDAADLRRLVGRIHGARTLTGTYRIAVLPWEEQARAQARRSIVTTRPLEPGRTVTPGDLCLKRPGTGFGPEQWDAVVGRTVTRPVAADRILTTDDLS